MIPIQQTYKGETVTATADAILRTLESPNVSDSNMEAANVVDVINAVAQSNMRIARAITSPASAGTDAAGGHVESLTEAVMGITAGLLQVAEAIRELAEAHRKT